MLSRCSSKALSTPVDYALLRLRGCVAGVSSAANLGFQRSRARPGNRVRFKVCRPGGIPPGWDTQHPKKQGEGRTAEQVYDERTHSRVGRDVESRNGNGVDGTHKILDDDQPGANNQTC